MIRYLTILICCFLPEQVALAQLHSEVRPVPASIHEVFIDSCAVIYGPVALPGQLQTRAVVPSRIFYLRLLLTPADSAFWAWGSFKIVYTLPSCETHEYIVRSIDFRPVQGGFAEISFTVNCNFDGWVDFTLAPTASHTDSNVYGYTVHSNFHTVPFRCFN
jgi:hypothetical protein